MALSIEWRCRLDNWRTELARHFYRPLGNISLEGYTTLKQLRVGEAAKGPFAPMPPGTAWGAKWEYAWFRGHVVLPPDAEGQRIVMRLAPGGEESAVYIQGEAAGAIDRHHQDITLTKHGLPAEGYDLMIEAYAGHGPRVASPGPVPPGRVTVPEPLEKQAIVGESTFGIWEEDAYQLWLDVEALVLRAKQEEEAALRRQVEAARRRLMRELGRTLRCLNHGDLNAVLRRLLQREPRRDGRYHTALELLGGYPTWKAEDLQDANEFARSVSDREQSARIAGSEIDAAIHDPRWMAQRYLCGVHLGH